MNQIPQARSFLLGATAATALLVTAPAVLAFGQSDPLPGAPPPNTQPAPPEAPAPPSRPAEDFPSTTATVMPSRATERVLGEISMLSGEAVRLSQIASQRASETQVRTFADQVGSSCRALEQEIDQMALNKNVNVPTGKNANEAFEEEDRWQRKNARDFDADYVKRAVKIHRDSIDALQDYVDDKDADAEVAAIALKHLPALRENLRQAESLRDHLD